MVDEGYILANKFRRAIFDELVSGERDIRHIAKKHRIIIRVAQKTADDLEAQGLVTHQGPFYSFTEEGQKLVDQMYS
jgi:predicted transcriptional regulator